MKALFVSGGTGGHVYPALAVARRFKSSGSDIYWFGKKSSLEEDVCNKEGFYFNALNSSGFRKKNLFQKIISIYYLLTSFIRSIYLIIRIKPDFIISFGGYLSLGPGLASLIFRTPLFIHEQNSIPGSANKILKLIAKLIFEGFPFSFKTNNPKVLFVGNPVREEIIKPVRTSDKDNAQNSFNLLVLGGSQGSSQLNLIVIEALKKIEEIKNWRIIHQAGKRDLNILKNSYRELNTTYKVEDFIEKIGEAYADSDLVIGRAGAMTVSELIATKTPSILLPLPWSTDEHQFFNAKFLEDMGLAKVIISDEENIKELSNSIKELFLDKEKRISMANSAKLEFFPDAVEIIFKKINESLQKDTK